MTFPLPPLPFGGIVGVGLSGGFVYWQVGRFAAPQVPVTLFDERKEVVAYTAGLFVGVPLAVAYLLFAAAMANGALLGALLALALLVGGGEGAQALLRRSRYFGADGSTPFYAIGLRAGVGGILALAVVTSYLEGDLGGADAAAATGAVALAVFALQLAGSLSAFPEAGGARTSPGGSWRGLLVGGVGYFLLGLGSLAGSLVAIGAGALVVAIAGYLYLRGRPALARIRPPGAPVAGTSTPGSPYGRTVGPRADPKLPENDPK